MIHVFLSPHFDDAVGSCGGTINRLSRAGEDVVVHTIFAGTPSPPYSALAGRLHAEWRSGDSPVAVRRAEDARACRVLGCRAEYSDWLDAIYRRRTTALQQALPDDWLYPQHAALFGVVAGRDCGLPAQIARQVLASIQAQKLGAFGGQSKIGDRRESNHSANTLAPLGERAARQRRVRGLLPSFSKQRDRETSQAARETTARVRAESLAGVRFYAPLGVGHHVDHVLAFEAGLELGARGKDVRFYEDFFYTDWNCPHLRGLRRRARLAPFSAADFACKLEAFRCYRSQIPTLFGSAARAALYFAEANRSTPRGSRFREVFWQLSRTNASSPLIEARDSVRYSE
jgi:GlcNAc-PI de-N-acetylase